MQKIILFIIPLLPFEKVTIVSRLKEKEIMDILNENIEPKKRFRLKLIWGVDDFKTYEGKIEKDSFKIKTIYLFNNHVNPIIIGKIENNLDFTKIQIKMRLSVFENIVYGILFFGLIIDILYFLIYNFNMKIFINEKIDTIFWFFIFYGIILFFFKRNCKKIETHFKSLFEV